MRNSGGQRWISLTVLILIVAGLVFQSSLASASPIVTLQLASPGSVLEGDGGPTSVTLNLDLSEPVAPGRQVVLQVSAGGGPSPAATPGSDFSATPQTVTFLPGESSKTYTFQVLGDTIDEANESVRVTATVDPATTEPGIQPGSSGTVEAVVIIRDDDGPTVQSISAPTVTEGQTASFTVTLDSVTSQQDVYIAYSTADGSATAGSGDYTARSGTLIIPIGQQTGVITVSALLDLVDEGTETFALNLNPAGSLNLKPPFLQSSATGTILDGNEAPVITQPASIAVTEDVASALTGISVSDVDAGSAAITLNLSVPSGTLSASSGGGVTVTGSGSGSLTLSGSQTNISALIAASSVSFTTAANATADVTLTIVANDQGNTGGSPRTDTKTSTLTVTAVNDPPSGPATVALTIPENAPRTISLTTDLGMSDAADAAPFPPIQSLTVSSPPAHGTVSGIDLTAGTFVYTPNASYGGPDSFQIQVCDQGTPGSACITQTINLTVTAVNDPPVNTVPGAQTTAEDTTFVVSGVSIADPDAASANVTLTLSVTRGTLVLNTGVSGGLTGAQITTNGYASVSITAPLSAINATLADATGLSYTPNTNLFGSDTLTVSTNDNGNTGGPAQTDTDTIGITVTSVNDGPPNASPDSAVTNEDTPISFDVLANDNDNADAPQSGLDPASVQIVTAPVNGTASVNGFTGAITYTPNPNYNGADVLTYKVCDLEIPAAQLCAQANLSLTVVPVNDLPIATADTLTTAEDTPATLDVLANDTSGPDTGETLSVSSVTKPNHGNATIIGGQVSYTPDANYNGPDSFSYTLDDGNGGAATGAVSVTVTAVNDPPTANPDSLRVGRNTSNTRLDVLANDSILPDSGEVLTITQLLTQPSHGSATLSGGVLRYTPAQDYLGPDTLSYQVCDNGTTNGAADPRCATATVTLAVVVFKVYLPHANLPAYADLRGSFVLSRTPLSEDDRVQVTVTITNSGAATASGFWVDFYINPTAVPSQPNTRWETVCTLKPCYGIAWYVAESVAPGQTITLTSTASSYRASNTLWTGTLVRGSQTLALYVDSYSCENGVCAASGAVQEHDETNNGAVLTLPQPVVAGTRRTASTEDAPVFPDRQR